MFDSPDSTMAPALTLQDCVDRLDAGLIPYSAANAKKVRGSANKCARLPSFNCPIMRIPADPVRFARTWRPYVERGETPEGFNTHAQFKTWFSNVHNLMLHATGLHAQRKALAAQVDDWTALEAAFEDLLRPGKSGLGFRQEDLFALHVLRNAAREDLLQPRDITAAVIYRFKLAATTGQKSSLTRAGRLLDRLRDSGAIPARLLPVQPIGAIPRADHRRQTPQFSPRVVAALARYREELAEGRPLEGFLKGLRTEGLSPETVKNELDGLNWYFSALIALDMLEPSEDPEPESFFTLSMIEAVFDAEADGTLPWKPLAPRTVKKNLGAVFRYAARLNPDFRLVGRVFFRKGFFDQCDGMTETNRQFCKRLLESEERIWGFLNLAWRLYEKAAPMMAEYDTLNDCQKARACHLAMAAAAAAILTFLPLRAKTLLALEVEGPNAHVFRPQGRREVNLVIPGTLVKNKADFDLSLKRRGKVDPRAILDWWLGAPRDRAMNRMNAPDPTRLLGGAGYSSLRHAWRNATAAVDFYMRLHQVRHGIASILVNQPNADILMIATLLGDLPKTVEEFYGFLDRAKQMQRGLDGLADVNRALVRRVRT
ncbi:MAG: hypothetical protein ACP5EN_09785 [Rhodovulum sp.]